MEPKIEQPKQHTQEEIAELEKSHTISDAQLLEEGAEYRVNEKGEKENLLINEKQLAKMMVELRLFVGQKDKESRLAWMSANPEEAMLKHEEAIKRLGEIGSITVDGEFGYLIGKVILKTGEIWSNEDGNITIGPFLIRTEIGKVIAPLQRGTYPIEFEEIADVEVYTVKFSSDNSIDRIGERRRIDPDGSKQVEAEKKIRDYNRAHGYEEESER